MSGAPHPWLHLQAQAMEAMGLRPSRKVHLWEQDGGTRCGRRSPSLRMSAYRTTCEACWRAHLTRPYTEEDYVACALALPVTGLQSDSPPG